MAKKYSYQFKHLFKKVSKEEIESIVAFYRAAHVTPRPIVKGKKDAGILGFGEQYVEELELYVTNNDCEEFLL